MTLASASPTFHSVFQQTKHQPRLETLLRIPFPIQNSDFSAIAQAGYPVIFTNAVPAKTPDWLYEIFCESFGSHVALVRSGDYANPLKYRQRQLRPITLRSYLCSPPLNQEEHPYIGNAETTPALLRALRTPPPSFYPVNHYKPARLWIGTGPTATPLHKDTADNFIYHVVGSKTWTVYPVRDHEFLYLQEHDREGTERDFTTSLVDLRNPDLARFPLLSRAHPISIQVHAGELLYLPMGWSHFVTTTSTSLCINHFMNCSLAIPGVLAGAALDNDPHASSPNN